MRMKKPGTNLLICYCTVVLLAAGFILLFSLFSFYRYPLLFPRGFTMNYWSGVIDNQGMWKALMTSCWIGLLNGMFSSIVGIITARALSGCTWMNQRIMTVLYSVPLMIPAMTLFIGVHQIMIRTGLVNTWMGVVLAHSLVTIPYTITLFLSFFKGVSTDLETVAKTLGAGTKLIYLRILLPLLRPILYMAFSISFLISFSEYFSTALIGGGRIITLSSILYPLISNGDINNASVMGLIFLLVNGSVLLLADRIARRSIGSRKYLYE